MHWTGSFSNKHEELLTSALRCTLRPHVWSVNQEGLWQDDNLRPCPVFHYTIPTQKVPPSLTAMNAAPIQWEAANDPACFQLSSFVFTQRMRKTQRKCLGGKTFVLVTGMVDKCSPGVRVVVRVPVLLLRMRPYRHSGLVVCSCCLLCKPHLLIFFYFGAFIQIHL